MEQEIQQINPTLERTERYKLAILEKWIGPDGIYELGESVLSEYLNISAQLEAGQKPEAIQMTEEGQDNINGLVSACIMLWKELKPKMKGKNNKDFMGFADAIKEPSSLYNNTEMVFSLMETLREALETLDITNLPIRL